MCREIFWLTGWGSEKIHKELIPTFGENAFELSQIKIRLQKFRSGELSYQDLPRSEQLPLTMGPQLKAFRQKCTFAGARVIASHFLPAVSMIQEILQRELGMKNSRGDGCPFSKSRSKSYSH
jgi:hypothetical protein